MARIEAEGDREVARFQRWLVPPLPRGTDGDELWLSVVVLTAAGRILERGRKGWLYRGRLACDMPTAIRRLRWAGWTEITTNGGRP